jgi:Tol biopolymer transport system component
MGLPAGSHLGPYDVLSPLGAGGMGEVYRARDPRLGRDVAIKIITDGGEASKDRLRRFEEEARAASALNHPNVLSVFDIGVDGGKPYVVFELLEGQTLRERLRHGLLPPRKAVEYGAQICNGLAAAHSMGIVHRDLKPENLFLTRDGRLKVLDFGLAKLTIGLDEPEALPDGRTKTQPGLLIGTITYMSPEQARGQPADARSDIFALGAVLYEMLSGRPAFQRPTQAETLSAILSQDPPEIVSSVDAPLSAGLLQIVRRCLDKNPDERFQSTRDLGFALSNLSGANSGVEKVSSAPERRKPWLIALTSALAVTVLPIVGYLAGMQRFERPVTSFQRLTFRRGANWSARFAPDGQTVVYAAAWDGQPIQLFTTRLDSPESRALEIRDADVLAISSLGELALALHKDALSFPGYNLGTLARMPLAGGAPREVLEGVQDADWSPDGTELAVIRPVDGRNRLEFPIGRVLQQTDHVLLSARVSPRGDQVAFIESDAESGDESRRISVVDRAGKKQTLTTGWRWLNNLAWSSGGDELWFAASQAGPHCSLWAVNRSGRVRVLTRFPALARLQDISAAGRALVSLIDVRVGVIGLLPGDMRERDLSWLDFSLGADLSADGRMLVGTESGEGTKRERAVYLRRTDGASPPVRLGDGFALALSPDARWVLSRPQDKPTELVLLPTGAGESKRFPNEGIEYENVASWAADGQRILVMGRQKSRSWRSFVMDLDGRVAPVTPEGVVAAAISPDGKRVAAVDPAGKILLYPVTGGDPLVAPGPPERGELGRWSTDGRSVFVTETEGVKVRVYQRDLTTGRRERLRDLAPADPAGISGLWPLLSADGRWFGYNFNRSLSNLYLVDGLK